MSIKVELRWYVKDSEKVLQYRYPIQVANYSILTDEVNYPMINSWSEWIDIPVVSSD
jgi:hypothetical protein